MNIASNDKLTVSTIDLSPTLRSYEDRSAWYMEKTLKDRPDVLAVTGVRENIGSVEWVASKYGSVYKSTNGVVFGSTPVKNLIVVSNRCHVTNSSTIPLGTISKGKTRRIAPDIVVVDITVNRNKIRVFCVDNANGPMSGPERSYVANEINKYQYKKAKTGDNSIAILCLNNHTDPQDDSMYLLKGDTFRNRYYPGIWQDIWAGVQGNDANGDTERVMDVFDPSIIVPSMVRSRRTVYQMVWGDIFGRRGTPIAIEKIGMDLTDDGLPPSSVYGLSSQFYIPDPTSVI